MSDVPAVLGRASAYFVATVTSVAAVASGDDDVWQRPTPSEVPVRELVEHVLAGNEFAVRLLAGASADDARAGIDEISLGPRPGAQAATSCAAQTEAFAAADRARPLHHPSGDIDFDTFVWFRLGELVVHAWDLAVAAGLDARLDPLIVDVLLAMATERSAHMRALGAFGRPSADLPPDASAQDRLLDAYGRRTVTS